MGDSNCRESGVAFQLRIEDLIALCHRRKLAIDLINLSVGTLMIDQNGIIGRGSAATPLAKGAPIAVRSDEVILAAAETFVVHDSNGMKSLLNRSEFEEFYKSN